MEGLVGDDTCVVVFVTSGGSIGDDTYVFVFESMSSIAATASMTVYNMTTQSSR